MASTGERLLNLLGLLGTRRCWQAEELVERLGVSDRTVRRDIERLRSFGYPIHASRGVGGGYRLGDGARLPPLVVNSDEAVVIAMGLQLMARQPIGGVDAAARSALAKIVDLLPPGGRSEIGGLVGGAEGPREATSEVSLATVAAVGRSMAAPERVRFNYLSAHGERTHRSVEPHHLVWHAQRWYLVAWDLDRHDWRLFRLDRVSEFHITKRRFERRSLPGLDPDRFVAERIAGRPKTYQVEVVVAAGAESVRRELGPWGVATDLGDGKTRIQMEVDDLAWVVLILADLDGAIGGVKPPELGVLLDRLSHRFANAS